jgi:alkylation response protein AidB-like acyl-CoA dehydrogenase
LPRTDVHLHDHWHTLGLQGSGSVDYEVSEVFVPEGCWAAFPMRAPVVDEPLHRFSTVGALAAGVAFVALGLARRAIDELILLATTKVPAGRSRRLAERARVQSQLVEAEAAWLSGRGAQHDAVAAGMEEAARSGSIDPATRCRLRVAAISAVERSTRAGPRLGSAACAAPARTCLASRHRASGRRLNGR